MVENVCSLRWLKLGLTLAKLDLAELALAHIALAIHVGTNLNNGLSDKVWDFIVKLTC